MKHAIALSALLAAMPAFAQQAAPVAAATPIGNASMQQNLGLGKHDTSAPIHLSADAFGSDVKTEQGDYVGNVVVTQGDMKMRADKMHFDTKSGNLSLITATSNVVVVAPKGTATGDHGVYDLTTHLITMTGNVVLTKQKNVMRGTKLVMDLTTNLAHMTAPGAPGGRVTAEFIPKQQQKPDSGTTTPPKPPAPAGN
jgi:lipopolysaccharide export system protein LptA